MTEEVVGTLREHVRPGSNTDHTVVQPFAPEAATLNSGGNNGGFRTEPGEHLVLAGSDADDPLLPAGLSSARYRCIGNGVAAPVAEWIAWRLADYFAEEPE